MIVSYELVSGGLQMREVKTEQEAFAEMRRFIELNHIASNETTVRWVEGKDNYHGYWPRHKLVRFGTGASFGIYYEGTPVHTILKSRKFWGVQPAGQGHGEWHWYYNSNIHKSVCWYDEMETYYADLAERLNKEGK